MSITEQIGLMNYLKALREKSPAPICGIVTETFPKMLKKSRLTGLPCPYASVGRLAEGTFQLGASYEKAVNRAVDKAYANEHASIDWFIAESMWGGKGVKGDIPFTVKHKDTNKLYLVCRPSSLSVEGHVVKKQDYWFDGNREISENELKCISEEFLASKPTPSRKQESFGLTGNSQVVWRTYALENVVQIRSGNLVYVRQ